MIAESIRVSPNRHTRTPRASETSGRVGDEVADADHRQRAGQPQHRQPDIRRTPARLTGMSAPRSLAGRAAGSARLRLERAGDVERGAGPGLAAALTGEHEAARSGAHDGGAAGELPPDRAEVLAQVPLLGRVEVGLAAGGVGARRGADVHGPGVGHLAVPPAEPVRRGRPSRSPRRRGRSASSNRPTWASASRRSISTEPITKPLDAPSRPRPTAVSQVRPGEGKGHDDAAGMPGLVDLGRARREASAGSASNASCRRRTSSLAITASGLSRSTSASGSSRRSRAWLTPAPKPPLCPGSR